MHAKSRAKIVRGKDAQCSTMEFNKGVIHVFVVKRKKMGRALYSKMVGGKLI